MKRISSKIKLLTPGSWLNSCCKVFLSFSLLVFSFSLLVGQTRKIDSLKQVVRNSSLPDTVKLEALDELTRSYMHINPDSGRKLAEQVIELGTRINNKYWIARGANEIGIYCEDQGNIADALVNYDRSMKLFQEVGDKKGMCSELTNMGNLCEVQGNYTGALIYYNRVLKLSEEVGNKYSMADAYGNIGLVNEDMGDYPEALKNFNHSIAIEKEIGDQQGEFTNLVDIGVVYQDQSNYAEALNYYLKGLAIAEKLGQKEEVCAIYVNIANVYQEQGNYVEALNNDQQCLDVAKRMGNKKIMAAAYGDIGNNYKLMGKYDEALKNQQLSLNEDEEIGFPSGLCSAYSNMGNIYDAGHDYHKALDAFRKSLAIAEKIGDKSSMCSNYSSIGAALMNENKPDQASIYLDSALALARKIGSREIVKNTYNYFTVLDSVKGNYSKAFNDFKLYVKYKDSLVNEANTRKIVSEQMNYEFEKKQAAEKAEQDKKDAITAADKKKQRTLTVLVSLGLLVVVAFSFLLFNRYKIASKQKNIIERQKTLVEQKNREVVSSITYAKRLQDAILPPLADVKRCLPESFILYKPKAIVAGDFYWMYTHPQPHLNPPHQGGLENPDGKQEPEFHTADPALYNSLKVKAELFRKDPTEAESVAWSILKNNSTNYHVRRQHIIGQYIVDFVNIKTKTVIEIDGDMHDWQKEEDAQRTKWLEEHGFEVVRFRNEEVIGDSNCFIKSVIDTLNRRSKELRDKVSPNGGDLEGAGSIFIAACDCTGHGVPGAMVSVVCSNALDRAVKEFGLTEPGKILDKARELVIETFEKSEGDIKDGMDISFCSIIKGEGVSSVRLNWSGANRPLWYFRGNELKEIAADKQPVGKHHIQAEFSTHSIDLQKGDTLYLFTDGYGDQFGGDKGKKFKYRQLQKLIVDNVQLTMAKQKELLEKAFNEWQGNLEQTDDVCVIGIRI